LVLTAPDQAEKAVEPSARKLGAMLAWSEDRMKREIDSLKAIMRNKLKFKNEKNAA